MRTLGLRRELERQGVADHTLVLLMSDNGRPFPGAKTQLTDPGIRTPFLLVFGDRVPAGTRVEGLVSSIDIAPTILELAGLPPSETFQGTSFVWLLEDPQWRIREYAFAERNWHGYESHERAVRSESFTYIRDWVTDRPNTPPPDVVRSPTFQTMRRLLELGRLGLEQMEPFVVPRAEEFLYDTREDPHALRNLAPDPRYADVLEELREALRDWQERRGDLVPEDLTPDAFDRESRRRLQHARE